MNLPFKPDEYRKRLSRLTASLEARGLDAMVTFVQENQYWLCGYETTGFHSFPQALVITAQGDKLLITRQLEIENALDNAFELPAVGYQDGEDPGNAIARGLLEMGLATSTIGLEKHTPWLTVSVFEAFRNTAPNARIVDCSGLIEMLRSIKSAAEVDYMRAAARAAGAAVKAGIETIREGVSELDVAAAVSAARIESGSHFTRNPTYITSGPRSALGHASWTGRRIESGDIVYLELGANIHHYDAALIRTAVAGRATVQMKAAHAASVAALKAALDTLKPGTEAREVHHAAKRSLERDGFGQYFDHRVGYGIGIEFLTWIERGGLSLDAASTQVLEPGMTVHLIPFFKVPGCYSIGCSETVLVSESGAEVLQTGCGCELFECEL